MTLASKDDSITVKLSLVPVLIGNFRNQVSDSNYQLSLRLCIYYL